MYIFLILMNNEIFIDDIETVYLSVTPVIKYNMKEKQGGSIFEKSEIKDFNGSIGNSGRSNVKLR